MSWILLAGALIPVMQGIPLSSWLVERLMPAAVENTTKTAHALSAAVPGRIPLSWAPGALPERILFGMSLFFAYVGGRVIAAEGPHSRRRLASAIAWSGVLISASHLAHSLAGATSVYGLYVPWQAPPKGPLLNPNHLAGFMSLTIPTCLGLALERRGDARFPWVVAATVLSATAFLAGSRAGTVTLIGGPVLFAVLVATRRVQKNARAGRIRAATIALGGAAAIAWLGFVLATLTRRDVLDTNYADLSKLDLLYAQAVKLWDTPSVALLGAGRGAFRSFFSGYHGHVRVLFSECLPLQYAIEFGIPVTVVALSLIGLIIFQGVRGWSSPSQLGCLVGVVAVAAQNLVDFSLETVGVAVPAVVCLAQALPASQTPARHRSTTISASALAGIALCGLGLTAILGPYALRYDLASAERRLDSELRQPASKTFWQEALRLIRVYPGDPTLSSLIAERKAFERDPFAGVWLNRTFTLAPAWGVPHLWSAYWATTFGDWRLARSEFRKALERDPDRALAEICVWLKRTRSASFALAVVPPSGPVRVEALNAAAACLDAMGRREEARRANTAILREVPSFGPAAAREARHLLGASQYAAALEQARVALSSNPRSAEAFSVEADALLSLGRREEAFARLEQAALRVDDRWRMGKASVLLYAKAHAPSEMRRAAEELRAEAAGSPRLLAEAARTLSHGEQALGNPARALAAVMEAYELGQRLEDLLTSAQLASELGQRDYALRAWERLCTLRPDKRSYCDRRDQLKASLSGTP